MLINNKSLINTINKLNLTDDEREKFNKISEDDRGNFLYNGKPVIGGATEAQAAQIEANKTAIGDVNSGLIKEVNDLTESLSNVDAVSLNGKSFSEPMTKAEYDALLDKDPNTIYLVDDDTTITGVPDYSISDANKVLAVNSNGTALAWIDAPSGSGNGLTAEQTQQLQTAYEHSQSVHIQSSDIPTKVSQLYNDSKYATQTYVTNAISEITGGSGSGGLLTDENGNQYKLRIDINGNLYAQCISGIDAYKSDRLLVYEENFTGNTLNLNNFSYELGNVRSGRIQTYVKDAVTLENNKLVLTATRGGVGVQGTRSWTSGSIYTCEKQAYLYGRWEAKIKLPNLYGAFPAFWTFGDRCVRTFDMDNLTKNETFIGLPYPWGGEIDIMEQAPSNHGGLNQTGACIWKPQGTDYSDDSVGMYGGLLKKTDLDTSEYHIYAMEWTPTYIEFFVDDVSIGRKPITSDDVYYQEPHFYILNLAMGSGGGNPDPSVNEMKMYVDWVRIYAPTTMSEVLPISSISIENFSSIDVGQTHKLGYTIQPENVGNRALKWTSSDNSICTAYGGYLIPKKGGTVTVTVTTANGVSNSIEVTCNQVEVPCTGISLNSSSISIAQGNTSTLTVSYTPETTTQTDIIWETSNDAIATVNNGLVTAVGQGSCVITAKVSANTSITATCSVTVIGIETLYTLNSETTLNGTNGIDTGIKLFDSNKAFTIFVDFTPKGTQVNGARLLQCLYDVSPYNGIRVAIIGGTKYAMVYNETANTDANGLGAINQNDETRHKLVITKEANSNTVKYYVDNTTAHTVNGTVDFGAIDNTLIFGYYTAADGTTKKYYWKGIIHQAKVYNSVLSSSEISNLVTSE